ncbi:MAG: ATP synthase F1 subunit gamma [Polyangiaceae bacterium]|nr:ATP synthase F1 subunit gamma [Polyangiaceae bacterium]
MASQKEIRTRIGSVKNTQKITRAMKMVAGARLNRAQARIQALRPYAVEVAAVLHNAVGQARSVEDAGAIEIDSEHPLLARREEKSIGLLVITSDRGLCGAFNSSILRQAEKFIEAKVAEGKSVDVYAVGRKGRDYFAVRGIEVKHYFEDIWQDLDLESARVIARGLLKPFLSEELDSLYVMYNEFKSAMTQLVVNEPLFPLSAAAVAGEPGEVEAVSEASAEEYIFEPGKDELLSVLVPMYVEVTLLRALYESTASELGARMTAMDSATKNAKDMIDSLTLQYNRARQAAITTELMEIIGGAEALNA